MSDDKSLGLEGREIDQ